LRKAKRKGEGKALRAEIAQKLEALAKALREGAFEFEGESWPLARDFLEYKWEVKIKEGKLKFSLSFRLDDTGSEQVFRPHKSPKQIKKQMGALWKSIWRDLRQERLPHPEDVKALEETFRRYEPFVEKAWEASWKECHERVKTLLEALETEDLPRIKTLASEILSLEKDCHRRYK